MYLPLQIAGFVATYGLAPLAVFVAIARFLNTTEKDAGKVLLLTVGLGPIALAWALERVIRFSPGHSDGFYVVVLLAALALLGALGRKQIRLIRPALAQGRGLVRRGMRGGISLSMLLVLVIVSQWLMILGLCWTMPITGYDPLEYAAVARILHRDHSFAEYPLDTPDPETGYTRPTAHPPGYISLIMWSYLWQGNAEMQWIGRTISPYHVLVTMLLIAYLLRKYAPLYAILANLLFITSPHYFRMAGEHAIDPMRMCTFLLSFVWLCEVLANEKNLRCLVVAGFAIAMGMSSHGSGILIPPFLLFAYFVLARATLARRLWNCTVMGAVACLIAIWQYLANFLKYGHPLHAHDPIGEIADRIDFDLWYLQVRRMYHASDVLLNGFLQGYTDILRFGVSFWPLPFALVFCFRMFKRDREAQVCLLVIAQFYALTLLTIALGNTVVIQNARYLMTILPFVVYLGALFLGKVYERVVEKQEEPAEA